MKVDGHHFHIKKKKKQRFSIFSIELVPPHLLTIDYENEQENHENILSTALKLLLLLLLLNKLHYNIKIFYLIKVTTFVS